MHVGFTAPVQSREQDRLTSLESAPLPHVRNWKQLVLDAVPLPALSSSHLTDPGQLRNAVLHAFIRRSGRRDDGFEYVLRAAKPTQQGHSKAANQPIETLFLRTIELRIERSEEDDGA